MCAEWQPVPAKISRGHVAAEPADALNADNWALRWCGIPPDPARTSRVRRFGVKSLMWAAVLSAVAAHAGADIQLDQGSPVYTALSLGQSAHMVIVVSNHGPDAAPSVSIGALTPFAFAPSYDYPLQMGPQPGCGTLLPGGPFGFRGYHFDAGPLAAGQTVHCVIDVTRNPTAVNSIIFGWQVFDFVGDPNPDNNAVGFALGTLTDVALSVEPVSFTLDQGVAHAVVRLRASNHGPAAVDAFEVGACTDNFPPPFLIDGNIPGGCGSSQYGPACFDSGFGFLFAELPAGQSASCNLALTGLGSYTGSAGFSISIEQSLTDPVTHGSLIDTNPGNDTADLMLAAPPEPIPAATATGRILIGFGLLVIGLIVLATPRLRQR